MSTEISYQDKQIIAKEYFEEEINTLCMYPNSQIEKFIEEYNLSQSKRRKENIFAKLIESQAHIIIPICHKYDINNNEFFGLISYTARILTIMVQRYINQYKDLKEMYTLEQYCQLQVEKCTININNPEKQWFKIHDLLYTERYYKSKLSNETGKKVK